MEVAAAMAFTTTGAALSFSTSTHRGLHRSSPLFAAPKISIRAGVQRRGIVRAIAEPVTRKASSPTIEESEAAVVAGNAPEAPPVPPKPKAPEGTPRISPLVRFLVAHISADVQRNFSR